MNSRWLQAAIYLGVLLVFPTLLGVRDDKHNCRLKRDAEANTHNDPARQGNPGDAVNPNPKGRYPTEEEHRSNTEAHWRKQIRIERIALLLSGVAAAAAIVAGFGAWYTYAETKQSVTEAWRQASAAEQNLSNTQRPFVVVRGLKMDQFASNLSGNPSWIIYPDVINMGNSSTRDMIASSSFGKRLEIRDPGAWQSPSDAAVESMQASSGHYDLGPQQILPRYAISTTFDIEGPDDCKEIFFFGEVIYGDKFTKDEHITKFCFIVGGPGEGGGDGKTPVAAPCSDYNCTDDGCRSENVQRTKDRTFVGRLPVKASNQSFAIDIRLQERKTTLKELRYDSPFEPGFGRCSNPPLDKK